MQPSSFARPSFLSSRAKSAERSDPGSFLSVILSEVEGSRARQRVSGRRRTPERPAGFFATPAFAQNDTRGRPLLHSDELLKRGSIVREKRARCQARSAPPTAPFPSAATQPAGQIAVKAASSARSAAPAARDNGARPQYCVQGSALPRGLFHRVVAKRCAAQFFASSYYWVQGSPLPKEVRNPRWVPHQADYENLNRAGKTITTRLSYR